MAKLKGRWRIGFDIGGTFTDFILYDSQQGAVTLHKRLTSPHDPSESALLGLQELVAIRQITLADVDEMIHGTTLVTNAIIERHGAKVGLITTRGFRDILEMGTEQRYDIYDLFLSFPEPMVPRALRREVGERMDRDGQIITPLDDNEVIAQLTRLVENKVSAVAVCFLHSYANPVHEKRVAELAQKHFPQLSVSMSHDVVAELWEYQRCATTCANAYVQPLMDTYLARLESELRLLGFSGALRLMHSAGGLTSLETARRFPIRLLESGPAGGGLATALFGLRAGQRDVISFDMGGTTAKACMIEDRQAEIAPMMEAGRIHRFKKGSGLPIKAPVIDMIEIGAGGGSIAAIDEVGLLRVGPQSAGSDPGPACYGMGGLQPTVTDANLLLGYYDPGFFLGGRMSLDMSAARAAMQRVGEKLGLSVEETAAGIHKVVVESMASAARVYLVEKGKDPRSYAMVGFGGAGPAHAAEVAAALGVREVIIPPASGAASALGFLAAPLSFESVRSFPVQFQTGWDAGAVNTVLDELAEQAGDNLIAAGILSTSVKIERFADMRLVGQMHDIAVALPAGKLYADSLAKIRENFVEAYTRRYTMPPEGARIEAINFRVRCSGPTPELSLVAEQDQTGRPALKGVRQAYFDHDYVPTPVYDRYALTPGTVIKGPAIIEEREATTVIPPRDHVSIDDVGNLRISIGAMEKPQILIGSGMSLDAAVSIIERDPIALEIMWSRLVNVVEEMWLTVCRTAFSLVISESQDFACELLDATGETLAHSPRAMPVFNLTLPLAVKALLERYPPETLREGDVLITNDPWLCAGHLFDIAVVTPCFKEGKLVGLLGTVGHVSDIGGTKDSLRAREIYEEGFQIPPMKLYDAGQANETLYRLLAENVRNSDQVIGDLNSFVGANRLGAERLVSFMNDYGMEDLRALAHVVQDRSEKAMRQAIEKIPDGTYHSTISNNPLGQILNYPVAVTVKGDQIEIDFDGAPQQLPQGGLNSTLNYTAAHATYPLKCMLTPAVRGNAGCYRPFSVKAPEGSVLNPKRPASVNIRTRTGWYIAPNIFRALADAVPAQVQAFTGLPVAANIYGQTADGVIYSDLLFVGGGQGASQGHDGKSGLLWPTSAANTSIELFETRVPVLVVEKAYIVNSGGAGKQRGGLGQRVRFRKLKKDGQTTLVSVYPEGVGNPTDGLFGGHAGCEARGVIIDPDERLLHDCGTGDLVSLNHPDEIVEIVIAGGAGFGDPQQRSRDLVQRDLDDELISSDVAQKDYGFR
jgi:5-oxoprolinase (ATP-hydrolysing)